MESHSASSSASSTTTHLSQTMQPTKGSISNSTSPPYQQSSPHSVRRSSSKPWRKPAVAPLLPTQPRIYKVDPINFKDLVQSLTGTPESLETPSLQSFAPAPIDVHRNASAVLNHGPSPSPASKIISPFSAMYKDLADTLELSSTPRHQKVHDNMVDQSYLRLNLQSPSSHHHWFSYPLLSPGTLSSLEQSTAL